MMTSHAETLKMTRSRIRIVSVGWRDDEAVLLPAMIPDSAETATAAAGRGGDDISRSLHSRWWIREEKCCYYWWQKWE